MRLGSVLKLVTYFIASNYIITSFLKIFEMTEYITLLSIIRQEKKYLTPPFIQTIPNNLEIERGNPKGFY